MKIQMANSLKKRIEYAEEIRRLSGRLVMSMNVCCLCCCVGAGGDLFCK